MKDNKNIIKTLKKSMRLKVLMLLAIMLAFNTFAWFIYSSTIGTGISTSVRAWKIEFESNDEVVQVIEFDLDELYPGMDEYTNYINVVNYGDSPATLKYEILSVSVLGTLYSLNDYTSLEMGTMLKENYPFIIEFELTNSNLGSGNGDSNFNLTVNWAYESGDDELDTTWGHDSYEFKQLYPDDKQIIISIKLTATQP